MIEDLKKIQKESNQKTLMVYNVLQARLPSSMLSNLSPLKPNTSFFRLQIIPNFDLYLSIACPFDMKANKCETALIKNNDIIYIDILEYEDIKRFDTIEELLIEIISLKYKLKQSRRRIIKFFKKLS